MNQHREPSFIRLWSNYCAAEQDTIARLNALLRLHLAVAERYRFPHDHGEPDEEDDESPPTEPGFWVDRLSTADSWVEWIPPIFLHAVPGQQLAVNFGPVFHPTGQPVADSSASASAFRLCQSLLLA